MMAQSTPFTVLMIALLIKILSYCSAENVYCVTPTATSCSSCPHNTHCATLSEYAQEAELYFTSNTTMVFLPGDHVLDTNITVANVAGLTMHGESSSNNIATVVRNVSVGFSFTNMVDFNIHSLGFTSYKSWNYGSQPASSSALLLHSTHYVKLVNCSFHDNLGTALTVNNTNITLAGKSEFIQNKCGCDSFTGRCRLGCGITAVNSNLTFIGNTAFLRNSKKRHTIGVHSAIHITENAVLTFNGTNNFINNSGNAIYTSHNTVLNFTGTSNFIGNHVNRFNGGSAIYASRNVTLTFNGTNNFINNSGSAIHASHNTALNFTGASNFIGNHATRYNGGSAIYTFQNAALTFNGTNNFINNSGSAIYTSDNTVLNFTGASNFIGNHATRYNGGSGGSAIYASWNFTLTFNGTNNFINNSGSAIHASYNTVLNFTGASNFIGNHATRYNGGSAIYTFQNAALTFNGTNNFINNSGSAIYTSYDTVLNFTGASNFIGNHATGYNGGSGGSAIYALWNVTLTFNGTNNFINNSAKGASGGAILARVNISLTFIGNSNFRNNSAQGNGGGISATTNIFLSFTGTSNFSRNSAMQGGAISAIVYSTLTFNGANSFTNNGHTTNEFNINNGVSCGGAMYLAISSFFSVLHHTTVHWENNHANLGGAICVSDANPSIYCTQFVQLKEKEKCFFQLSTERPGQNLSGSQLVFKNNSADFGGSVLFGGAIDNCVLNGMNTNSSGEVFDMLIINNVNNTASKISSNPIKICPCKKNLPKCNRPRYFIPYPLKEYPVSHIRVYPGETFQISVVAVGQREGTVSTTVRSTVTSTTKSVNLLDYQYLQQTKSTCTELNYTVFSLSQHVKIEMHPEGSPCYYNSKLQYWLVQLNQTCPPGFNISEEARSCVCEPRLAHYTNHCNITNGVGRITREPNQHFWVGFDNLSHEIILRPYCPFDYCVNDTVVFPLNDTDVQCAYNRSGLLCGRCKEGYSRVLGSHRCRKCTNSHLALLIPFALMGVALVFLLLVCKLTVATGTLSGLVLYANIVGPNRTIFLPVESTDALSIFIAWLNLDFGIETCFYDGMDTYSKTLLQFVFPVYLWMLVGLMIIISHYSQRFTNLLGSNPVSVLATLILFSYTKLLHTLISAGSFVDLHYPDNFTRRVWLHDANIDYFHGKNIPLFLMALFFLLFIFLPYTLLLFFGQWLQTKSHLRLFSWVNSARLKPFMDSYHAPYKPKHRYWPGLLLVLRSVLTLVFAFNDPSINLLAIVVGAGILQLWAWVIGGVYKNWCLDALEGSFVLNLIILGAATYYVDQINGDKLAVGYTSVSIALVTFIAILAYHMFQQLRQTKLWKKVLKLKLEFKKLNTKQAEDNLNNPINNAADFDQLREPWLEDLLPPTHSVV